MGALFDYEYKKCTKCGHYSFFPLKQVIIKEHYNGEKEKLVVAHYLKCTNCGHIFKDPTFKEE